MQTEWESDRTRFAQQAEALDVTTDSIMAASKGADEGFWRVLYTLEPTADDDAWIWYARLDIGDDGILAVAQKGALCTIGSWKNRLDQHLRSILNAD